MRLVHRKSGAYLEAVIELVQDEDWAIIQKNKNFEFNWIEEKKHLVHKITLKIETEILGLISIEDIPKEFRLFVRLIETSSMHKGRNKVIDNITGCLLAFTCDLAFQKGYDGFVSLVPKTQLINHYKLKYGFQECGNQLFVELERSEELIKKYLENG